MVRGTQHTYDAFISYGREDQDFALRLVKRLRAYTPPKALGLPRRPLSIFFDQEDIHGSEYFRSIEQALSTARKLIVLCSPDARASEYVNDEIRRFCAQDSHTDADVILVLVRGLANNEAKNPEDESNKAFPEALYDHMVMPLAYGFAGFDPGRHRIDAGAYQNAWFSMLATLLEVSRSELEERERRRRARQRTAIASVTTVVIVALSVLATVAWVQREEAVDQRRRAYARQLAAQAQSGLQQPLNAAEESVRRAITSLRLDPNEVAFEALKTGLNRLEPKPLAKLELPWEDGVPKALTFNEAVDRLAVAAPKATTLWDLTHGRQLARIDGDPAPRLPLHVPGDRSFQDIGEGVLPPFFLTQHNAVLAFMLTSKIAPVFRPGRVFRLDNVNFEVVILDARTGRERARRLLADPYAVELWDGRVRVAVRSPGGGIDLIDLPLNEVVAHVSETGRVSLATLDAKRERLIVATEDRRVSVWGLDPVERQGVFTLPKGWVAFAIAPETGVLVAVDAKMRMAFHSVDTGKVLETGKVLGTMVIDPEERFLRFEGNGYFIVTRGADGRRHVYGLGSRIALDDRTNEYDMRVVGDLERRVPTVAYAVPENGFGLITARADGRITIWQPGMRLGAGTFGMMPGINPVIRFDHGAEFQSGPGSEFFPKLVLSPDGHFIASQNGGPKLDTSTGLIDPVDATLRLWDRYKQGEVARLRTRLGFLLIAFDKSGKRFATVSEPVPELSRKTFFSETPEKNRLVPVRFWELIEDQVPQEDILLPAGVVDGLLKAAKGAGNRSTASLPNAGGGIVAWVNDEGRIMLWHKGDAEARTLENIRAWSEKRASEGTDRIRFTVVRLSDDGSRLLLTSGAKLRLYQLPDGRLLHERTLDGAIFAAALSHTGEYVAVTHGDWQAFQKAYDRKKKAKATALSHTGEYVAVTHGDWQAFQKAYDRKTSKGPPAFPKGTLHTTVLDLSREEPLAVVAHDEYFASVAALSPDGRHAVFFADDPRMVSPPTIRGGRLELVHVPTGTTVFSEESNTNFEAIRPQLAPDIAFSPDGKAWVSAWFSFGRSAGLGGSAGMDPKMVMRARTTENGTLLAEHEMGTLLPTLALLGFDGHNGVTLAYLEVAMPMMAPMYPLAAMFEGTPDAGTVGDKAWTKPGHLKVLRVRTDPAMVTEQEKYIARACARLPDAYRTFDSKIWAREFPGERYKALCPDSIIRKHDVRNVR